MHVRSLLHQHSHFLKTQMTLGPARNVASKSRQLDGVAWILFQTLALQQKHSTFSFQYVWNLKAFLLFCLSYLVWSFLGSSMDCCKRHCVWVMLALLLLCMKLLCGCIRLYSSLSKPSFNPKLLSTQLLRQPLTFSLVSVFSQNWLNHGCLCKSLVVNLIYSGRQLYWMISSLYVMKGSFASRNLPSTKGESAAVGWQSLTPSTTIISFYAAFLGSLADVLFVLFSDDSGILQLQLKHIQYCFDWTIYDIIIYIYPLRLFGLPDSVLGHGFSKDPCLESRFDLKATLPLLSCISCDWNIQSRKLQEVLRLKHIIWL